MARKRRLVEAEDLDSSGSSSGESDAEEAQDGDLDPDERAERQRHRDPYGSRKRRRGNVSAAARKEQAQLGIWAAEEDDEGDQGARRGPARSRKPATLLKTPAFVKSTVAPDNPVDVDNLAQTVEDTTAPAEDDEEDMDESDDDDDDDDSEKEAPRVPRVRSPSPDAEASRPAFGAPMPTFGVRSGAGLGASAGRGGRGGLGMVPPPVATAPPAQPAPDRKQTAFLGAPKVAPPPQPVKLGHRDKTHFAKLEKQGGLGFRMLAAQGWKAGTGLGQEGKGIVAPIESRLRPRGMGIGHDGFGERTQTAIEEAKRRGQHMSDDEDEKAAKQKNRRGRGGSPSQRDAAWKQPKRERKPKTEFRSYEEILAATGDTQAVDGGLGQIVDLTGAELPSLAATLTISGQPVFDDSRLPELRHNLRLITDTAKGELDALAREAKAGAEKRRWLVAERTRTETRVGSESARIGRLKAILADVEELVLLSKASVKAASTTLPTQRLATFDGVIDRLLSMEDYAEYELDEAVVAALAPCLRQAWAGWDPLDNPKYLVAQLDQWRKAFRIPKASADMDDIYAARTTKTKDRSMTPYESLLWTHWLPRIRSAINGAWQPDDSQPAVELLTAWSPVLPAFVRDNVLDQLILPKLSQAIADWSPRRSGYPLNHLVFPWLPHLGDRLEQVTDEAKRRLKSSIKAWRPTEGVPADFAAWRKLFGKSEWETLLLQHVLPPLAAHLRGHFTVNPRKQELEPLVLALAWRDILRPAMLSQLLEAEFVPKWLDALYTWLTARPDFGQVHDWYKWWKAWLVDQGVGELDGVRAGTTKALNLMNAAATLGDDAEYLLEKPDTRPTSSTVKSAMHKSDAARAKTTQPATHAAAAETVPFRELVEAYCAERDILFVPLGRAHATTGAPLFRAYATDKKGVHVYVEGDVVYAQPPTGGEAYRPVGMEEMVARARK